MDDLRMIARMGGPTIHAPVIGDLDPTLAS